MKPVGKFASLPAAIRALVVGLCLSPMAQAQTNAIPQELREIYDLIRSANRQIGALEDDVTAAEQDIARLQNTSNRRSRDQEALERAARALDIGTDIADHEIIRLADTGCRDEFQAAGNPNLRFSEAALVDCAQSLLPRVPHPAPFECASLYWSTDSSGRMFLTGRVKTVEDLAQLQAQFGQTITARVEQLPFPTCEALDVLELPLSSDRRPTVGLLSNLQTVTFGESLAFRVTTPDFYAFVYVVYLQADGSVVNLMPRRRLMRAQQHPNTTLYFGDGRDGRQTYTASPPRGAEAIIVLAARSPIEGLDILEAPEDGQFKSSTNGGRKIDQAEFLRILRSSLDVKGIEDGGRREISAGILHLNVIPY